MTLADNLITIGILFGLFILAYCRIKNVTITELYHEIKDMFTPNIEEYKL